MAVARIRRRAAFALFALLLAACSQTPAVRGDLSPQFGETTAGADAAQQLAAGPEGVFVGGVWNGRSALIKFSRAGRIPWVRTLPRAAVARAVAAAPGGAAYALYTLADAGGTVGLYARGYSREGVVAWTRRVTTADGGAPLDAFAATDGGGNLYVAASLGYLETGRGELRKYRPDGAPLWLKPTAYVYDLGVSRNGFAHTVTWDGGTQALTRYKPDGKLLWRVPVPYGYERQAVAVGGESEIYVASHEERFPAQWFTTLTRYNSRGERVWGREVASGVGQLLDGLEADAAGTALLALTRPNADPEFSYRPKSLYAYSASGRRLSYRVFDFGAERPLVGPAALRADETYVALAGDGGGLGGPLVRLDALTGVVAWTR